MANLYHHIAATKAAQYGVTAEPALPVAADFLAGMWIAGSLPNPLVFEVDHPSRLEVPHFVGTTIPVFSALLIQTFRSAGVENFQLFPAVLRNPALGESWDDYWAFNAVGLMAAADVERSDADTVVAGDSRGVAPPLLSFRELVLDHKKTRNVAMFRLAENSETLLVHDRVLEHIKQHRPPQGWGFEATAIETI